MTQTLSNVRLSELYRQLGVDAATAERQGAASMLGSVAGAGLTANAAFARAHIVLPNGVAAGRMTAHANLERHS